MMNARYFLPLGALLTALCCTAVAGPHHPPRSDGLFLAAQITGLVRSVLFPPLVVLPPVTAVVYTQPQPSTVIVQPSEDGTYGSVIVDQPVIQTTVPTVIYQERAPIFYYDPSCLILPPVIFRPPPPPRPRPPRPIFSRPRPPRPVFSRPSRPPQPPVPRPQPQPVQPKPRPLPARPQVPPLKYPIANPPGQYRPDPNPGRYQRLPTPARKYQVEVPTYAPAPPKGQWQPLPSPSRNYRLTPRSAVHSGGGSRR